MHLLEREREAAELEAAIQAASAGQGRAVAIEGDAGVGKTSLLREACAMGSAAGLRAFPGRATELERDFPFSAVRQLYQRPLTEMPPEDRDAVLSGASTARVALGLDDPNRGELDLFAVLHGLYWVTTALAERTPLLLAIDDAQLADDGSLDYLAFMLPRLEALPVLLIFTCRHDRTECPAGLEAVLSDQAVGTMSLKPLSVGGTAELIGERMGVAPDLPFADACSKATGGNPFLLSELVHTLVEQGVTPTEHHAAQMEGLVPDRVARAIQVRVSRLSPVAGTVARALAVLGDGADIHLISEFSGLDVAAARDAVESLRGGSIVDGEVDLRFAHPLVRKAVYEGIPVGERALRHAEAAGLLRSRSGDRAQIAAQVLVSERRGDPEAVETLLQAAERALATGAPGPAVSYLTRALQEPPSVEMRPTVLHSLLTAGFRAADLSVLAAIESDIQAEIQREPALQTRWAMGLTMSLVLGGRFEEAISLLRSATSAAAAAGDLELAFQLDGQLNAVAVFLPGIPEKMDLYSYRSQIPSDGHAGRLMAATEARSAVIDGSAGEAVEAARRALGNDGSIFADEAEQLAPAALVMTLVAADELGLAREGADRAFAIASGRGATTERARAYFLRGFVSWGEGDLINSEVDLRKAIELVRLAGFAPVVPIYAPALIEVLIERDEIDAAQSELEATGLVAGPLPEIALFTLVRVIRGHLAFERADFEQAIEDFEVVTATGEQMGFGPGPRMTVGPQFVRSLMATGRVAEAHDVAESMIFPAKRWGAPATVAHVLGAVAAARGGDDGIEALEEAVALLEDSPRRLQHAHALVELGAALRRAGRRRDARIPLRRSLTIGRRGGAMRVARRAHEELSATGEKVPRLTAVGIESLTPSERRVADLAASGMTNRQIAQSLFVTVKTVEAHLSSTYGKLDIESRKQLRQRLQPASTS